MWFIFSVGSAVASHLQRREFESRPRLRVFVETPCVGMEFLSLKSCGLGELVCKCIRSDELDCVYSVEYLIQILC